MTEIPRPKVLLLDFGNVLVRLEPDAFLERLSALRPGLPITPEEWRRALDDPATSHDAYDRGQADGREFHAGLCRRLGLTLDYPAWVRLWDSYFVPNRPMEALVADLRGQVRVWGLSNTNPEHLSHLRMNYRVLEAFEGVTASCEAGAVKPEPAIYAAALKSLGVAGEEVLYLDDVPKYLEGARAFGIRTFHYTFNDAELKAALLGLGFSLPPLSGVSALGCA